MAQTTARSRIRDRAALVESFSAVRAETLELAAPLSAEDQCVQSMPDASPVKWHLAHTTWFFEAIVLAPHVQGYQPYNSDYFYLFNSYYESLGPRHPRPARGLLTRPSAAEVADYRRRIDEAMVQFIEQAPAAAWAAASPLVELGLQHEQQHQELILTDIKHALSCNPLRPDYRAPHPIDAARPAVTDLAWSDRPGGIVEIGHGGDGFAFDNETPRHPVLLQPYRLAERLITNGEYRIFVEDGGYRRADLWLSDGWATIQAAGWQAPLYWEQAEPDAPWQAFTLHGLQPLDDDAPVTHVSLYEAAAFAAWAGKRLPTEFEWEAAADDLPVVGRFLDTAYLRPRSAGQETGLKQMFGDAWEWTRSSYDPYPGFRPLGGALAEYNGKFMVSQTVLRGGSCVTPAGHMRASYRNFFPPAARWQFSGIRLAEDL